MHIGTLTLSNTDLTLGRNRRIVSAKEFAVDQLEEALGAYHSVLPERDAMVLQCQANSCRLEHAASFADLCQIKHDSDFHIPPEPTANLVGPDTASEEGA